MINKNDEFFLIYKNSLTLRQKLTIKKMTKNCYDAFFAPFKIDFAPLVFRANVKNKVYLYAFETEMDMPLRFRKKYSRSKRNIEFIICEINAINAVLNKEVDLVVNPFSENPVILTQEDLKEIKNG